MATNIHLVTRRMPAPAGRFAVVRDVLIVAVCLALVVNFLVQLWHARPVDEPDGRLEAPAQRAP